MCFTIAMNTTTSDPSARERLSTVRTYRRLFWACFGVAVLGFVAGSSLGYPLAALGVYWVGVLAMLVVWKGTSIQLFDEREKELDRRASHLTITIVGFVLIVGGPGQILFSRLGYELSPLLEGALFGYAAQFALFGVVYLWLRYRP